MVQKIAVFFAGIVILSSCGYEGTSDSQKSERTEIESVAGGVDLDTENADRQAISIPFGTPTKLIPQYYSTYWSGEDWTLGPGTTPSYTVYTNQIYDNATAGFILQYLSLDAGDGTISWTVKDIDGGTHGLFEVEGTSGYYDRLVMKTGKTLDKNNPSFYECKNSSSGITRYCKSDACKSSDEMCYDDAGAEDSSFDNATLTGTGYHFVEIKADAQNLTNGKIWMPLGTDDSEAVQNLNGDSVRFNPGGTLVTGTVGSYVQLDSDVDLENGLEFKANLKLSSSVLIRMYNCNSSEDYILADANTNFGLSGTTSGSDILDGSQDDGDYYVATGSETGDLFGDGVAGDFCEYYFIFDGTSSDNNARDFLRSLSYNNSEGASATEGNRILKVFARSGNGDDNSSTGTENGAVSQPATFTVGVWNDPIITEVTPVVSPTNGDPFLFISVDKAGTLSIEDNGAGDCGSVSVSPTSLSADTVTKITLTHSGWTDQTTYSGCRLKLTSTTTAIPPDVPSFTLEGTLDITAFTYSDTAVTLLVEDDNGPLTSGDSTADNTLHLSGGAAASSTINYAFTNTTTNTSDTGSVSADSAGIWSLTTATPTLSDATYEIVVDDGTTQQSGAKPFEVTIDTTPPDAPTIVVNDDQGTITGDLTSTATTDDTILALSGTMESGATIAVTGVTLDGAVSYPTATTWAATTATLTDGSTYNLSVTAIDGVGNISSAATFDVTVDTTPPAVPVVTTAADDVGSIQNSSIDPSSPISTDDTELFLEGTAEADATISIDLDGVAGEEQNTTATGGAWSFTTNVLSEGANTISITAVDAAGNISTSAATVSVTIDTNAPDAPTIVVNDDQAPVTGELTTGDTTNDTVLALSGTMESGATIAVTGVTLDGAVSYPTATTWAATTATLTDSSTYNVSVTAIDSVGNISSAATFDVTVDTTAPADPGLTTVSDDQGSVQGPLTTGDSSDDTELVLTGTKEADSDVTIAIAGITLDASGVTYPGGQAGASWSATTATLTDGDTYNISITAVDAAGNPSNAVTFDVTIDTSAPSVPTLLATDDQAGATGTFTGDLVAAAETHTDDTVLALSGTAEADSILIFTGITLDATDPGVNGDGTVTVDNAGNWEAPTETLTDGTTYNISFTATDSAGNTSTPKTFDITVDTTAPDAPTIISAADNVGTIMDPLVSGDTTDDTEIEFSGSAEADATISIDLENDGTPDQTVVATGGTWNFTTNALSDGLSYDIALVAIDAAGNQSPSEIFSITIDSTAPTQPSLVVDDDEAGTATSFTGDLVASAKTHTDDTVLVLSGTKEANEPVAVSGVDLDTSGVTYPDGTVGTTWTATTDVLAEGSYTISVDSTDVVGNSSAATTFDIVVDTTVLAPVLSSVADDVGTLQGNLTSGDETDDTVLVLTGTAEANSTLTFTGIILDTTDASVNGDGTVTVDSAGDWSAPTETLIDGTTYNISFTTTDLAGNLSTATTFDVTIDTTAPLAPTLAVADDQNGGTNSSFTGDLVAASETHTDDTVLVLSGAMEENAVITVSGVSVDGTVTYPTTTSWQATTTTLTEATYNISVTATDASENESVATTFDIIVDTTVLAPVLSSVADDVGTLQGNLTSGDETDDTVLVLTGTAEANSTLIFTGITLDTADAGVNGDGTVTVDSAGDWSAPTETLIDGTTYNISFTATDLAGNVSAATTFDVTIDTTAPDAPTLVLTDDDNGGTDASFTGDLVVALETHTDDTVLALSGTMEENAIITVSGVSLDGTVTYPTTTSWGATTVSLAEASYTFSITATDASGNESAATEYTITVDTTKPNSLTLIVTDDFGPNTGDLTDGQRTDDTELLLTGDRETDATVSITGIDVNASGITYPTNSTWSATTISGLTNDTTYSLSITETDLAGNVSDPRTFDVLIDTYTETTLVVTDDVNVHTGDLTSGDLSNDSQLLLSGTATNEDASVDEAATVVITATLDGSPATIVSSNATTDASGDWNITTDTLTDGTYVITADVTDVAGNTNSIDFTVISDLTAPVQPTLVITDDVDGGVNATFTGDLVINAEEFTDDSDLLLSGTAEANSLIWVDWDNDGSPDVNTVADGSGDWSVPTGALAERAYTFSVTSEDAAGNTSTAVTYDLTVDTTAPDAPVITGIADAADAADFVSVTGRDINAAALEVYGTAENFSTLEISGHTMASTGITSDTNATPNWTGITDAVVEGVTYTFSAVATDRAGNRSAVSVDFAITIDLSATAPTFAVQETDASGAQLYDSTGVIAPGVVTHATSSIMGTTATELYFAGTAEAGGAFPTTVDIYADSSSQIASVQEDGSGSWTATTSSLADGQYIIEVNSTDDAGNVGQASAFDIIIDTTGPNLPPLTVALNIDEMSLAGTAVGSVAATDAGIEGITYAETGGSGLTYFEIDQNTGAITFLPDGAEELDFETDSVLYYQVTTTDALGNSEAQSVRTFSILINDLNDSPVVELDGTGNPQDYAFASITENAGQSAEKTVSQIINDSSISPNPVDPDGDTQGIAIYAVSSTGPGAGSWFYNIDNSGWTELNDLSNAVILDNNDRLRFQPDGENGETSVVSFYVTDDPNAAAITPADLQDLNNRGGENNYSINEMTASIVVTDVNDAPVFATTLPNGSYIEDTPTIDLSGAEINDVDFGEALTMTISLGAISWPDDANAPDGTGFDFDQDGDPTNDSVRQTLPGTLSTTSFAWDPVAENLVITGTVAEVNVELDSLTLTPITDLDFDFTLQMVIADDDNEDAVDSVSYSCATRSSDPPVAMIYTGVYDGVDELDAATKAQNGDLNDTTELSGANLNQAYIRLDGRESWDPDFNDQVVTYIFYPSRPVNTTELRDGENATGGTFVGIMPNVGYSTTNPVIVYKADLVDFVSWRLAVVDSTGEPNLPGEDQYDEAGVEAANTAPYAAIFPAGTECSRTHAEAAFHPTFVDLEADCFCDSMSGNGGTCLNAQGETCSPTKINGNLVETPAVFASVTASGDSCYCNQPICDGTDGTPICYKSNGSSCTPTTQYCTPVPSPNDYSYPFDHNIDLTVCAYDVDQGDVLSYSWDIAQISGQSLDVVELRNGDTLETAPLDSQNVRATILSTGPAGFSGFADFDLAVTISDGEDDTVITMNGDVCIGSYEDDDQDEYVNENSYYANCTTTSAFDIPIDSSIAYLQQDDPTLKKWDCFDKGEEIVDSSAGSEASKTKITPELIKDSINWYIDTDGDGYGSSGSATDDADGNNILDVSTDDGDTSTDLEIVYGGKDVPGNCVLEKPVVQGYEYMLNDDDCNDSQDVDFTYTNLEAGTQVTRSLGPDFQSPETVWQLDADSDGFASNYIWDPDPLANDIDYSRLYFSDDYTCLCDEACGNCAKPRVQPSSTTSAQSCDTTPSSCVPYKAIYTSCENPAGLTLEDGLIDANSTWIIGQRGDCNEAVAFHNPTAQEECDDFNADEDCNGFADDNDTNVNGALAYYKDGDGDGFPNENQKVESCDGGSEAGFGAVKAYDLSNAVEADVDGNVLYDNNGSVTAVSDCVCATDSCSYACISSSSTAANITYCTANPDQTVPSTCEPGSPYDPQDTEYDSFEIYVFDCDDTRTGVYPTHEELCDGVLNDCVTGGGIPSDEVDFDNDKYVECDYQGGWLGGVSTEPNIGSDCSPRDPNVYPNAPSICDGQYNNCASWVPTYADEDGDCFCTGQNADNSCADSYCVDETGDLCVPTDLDNDTVAVCSLVEGQMMSPGAPTNQVDNDGDCYVECYDGSTTWMGDLAVLGKDCLNLLEGEDCNDASSQVHPGAPEVCDGQYNDCDAASYDPSSAPSNERDDDLDSYVDCAQGEFLDRNGCVCFDSDASGVIDGDELGDCKSVGGTCIPDQATLSLVSWVSQPAPGYSDCDDLDPTRYPGANEICDGQFNDCYHELLDPFTGVAGDDCYCADQNGSSCVTSAGDACTPDGDLIRLSTAETVNTIDYDYQEVECYCTNTACEIDIDGDELSDCLDENSDPCQPTDDDRDGFADNCVADPISLDTDLPVARVEYLFNDVTNNLPEAPGRELDNDNDTYIECNIGGNTWLGSPNVVGGGDCDDYRKLVKPGGTEFCDGQYNDCDALTYSEISAPVNEIDNDLDGYVECELTPGVSWERTETEPTGYGDCDDLDATRYPTAPELCDGVYNDCTANGYDADSAPIDEQDLDSDGFVECSDAGAVWKGDQITGYDDCEPSNASTYPGAVDICDAQFNDCEHPMRADSDNAGVYAGVVGDCFCAVTQNGSGEDVCDASDCVDSLGASCTPADSDNDGFVDDCEIADATGLDFNGGGTYYGVEVDCYCPTEDCRSNVSGNSNSECYTPDGSTCSLPFNASGIFFDCATTSADVDLTVSHVFLDENGSPQSQPFEEYDNDSDGYVECEQFDLDAYRDAGGSLLVVGGSDCDDTDGRVYPQATEYCDGQYNNCDSLTYTETGAPENETDDDGDGYVECELTAGVPWERADTEPTGYGDCDDDDAVVYPTAQELCDGVYNDCSNGDYDPDSAPIDERDIDSDGYVECSDVGAVWKGAAISGYDDCDSSNSSTYPGAPEICDANFNDCEHPMRADSPNAGAYQGVVGDCFCAVTQNGSGEDVCDASDCVDSLGASCTPADEDDDGFVDDCEIADLTGADFNGGGTYYGVEVDCYCPTDNCRSNISGNSSSECYTPSGGTCSMPFNSAGLFLDCATSSIDADLSMSHVFLDENGDQQSQPFEEYDNDGDRYVECEQFDLDAYQDAGGSLLVLGGSDCDDTDRRVYPGAVEYCDGQYNNCTAEAYTETGAPENETDNDGDGYVECELSSGVAWNNPDTEPVGYADCNDSDKVIYPSAPELCDGVYNDCSDSDYAVNSAPEDELDGDADGFVACEANGAVWKGGDISGYEDCAPTNVATYPGAPEVCDANFNDCEHPMRSDSDYGGVYQGVVGDCFCAVTQNGSGEDVCDASDCVDASGASCTPTDEDQDGFVDHCEIADSATSSSDFTQSGNVYYGVEVECYCPSDDCQANVSGDSETECYTPEGMSCFRQYNATGLFEDCATSTPNTDLLVNHIFRDDEGDQQSQPFEEYDNDGDNYVECEQFDREAYRDAGGSLLVVGGSDCDDTDVRVHPTANEVCDGQYNDCNDLNYSDVGAPANETDNDADGYVECEWDADTVPWLGSVAPLSGVDCNDADANVYPTAPELCDGQHNDCSSPIYLTTTAPKDEIDDDGDGYVECGYDGLNLWSSDDAPEFGTDCDDSSATRYPDAEEICDGVYNNCTVLTELYPDWPEEPSLLNIAPPQETDDDSDGYVECDFGSVAWVGSALNVSGGMDCDDADSAVYPTAAEVCDGQINDCENGYTATGVPVDELDDDGDGWVECMRSVSVEWNSAIGAPQPNQVLANKDPNQFSDACVCNEVAGALVCAKQNGSNPNGMCNLTASDVELYTFYASSDCDDEDDHVSPFIAIKEYEQNGNGIRVSNCMQDQDEDGYGSTLPTNGDVPAGQDCDDLNSLIHPRQDEFCEAGDQVDNDCNGDVNTAETPYQLDTSNATFLYIDDDHDGFGDIETEATPACVVSDGFVFNQTDCNDSDPAVNPIQEEICDGIDQDCDAMIDEVDSLADPSISRCTNMFRDVDGDNYGDLDIELCLCDTIDEQGGNPAGVEEHDGDNYVIYSGDCYDFNPNIHPLTCADNIDNDEDGVVDAEDPDCIAGYEEVQPSEGERAKEEDFELLDGHDNNCDGMIAAVELDCDDDGSFPLVPNEGFGFNRSQSFTMAYDIGLEVCDGLNMEISCWGETQRLVCDKLTAEIIDGEMSYEGTGLWMLAVNESEDGYGGRYDAGHREYPNGRICGASKGDCDDQCPDRCPGQAEECDGIDNDCDNALPGTDGGSEDSAPGIPDAMVAEVPVAGNVSETEIDIDGDGYLACKDFDPGDDQFQFSAKSCGDSLIDSVDDNDCNNFCSLTNPNAEEHCDGFQGVCDGENLDGTDADNDDGLTCGSWSGADTAAEDIFVVVWLKEVDWAAQGSEPQEMYRPNVELDIPDQPSNSGEDTAAGDTADDRYSVQQSDRELRTQRRQEYFRSFRPEIDAGGGLINGDIEAELLEDMIPLIAPRDLAPHCDSYLETQLTLLLGNERMEQIRDANSRAEASRIMLEACESDFAAGCGVVRLVLNETIDDDTYAYLDEQIGEPVSFSEECLDRPEEWISRTMWQRERILDARTTTVEWECRRMFGRDCSGATGIRSDDQLQDDWEVSMISAERWLDVDRVWYKEIGRYYPDPIDEGTLMSCWGDPTDTTISLKKDVGGDCNDESSDAHRDKPEGPGDLVGLYLYGDLEDCSTCLDGIDNNCDGAIDCADPTCAPCFVGQGVGCGGGSESPCAQGGCSTPDQSGEERMYRSFALIMMALIVSLLRRREDD